MSNSTPYSVPQEPGRWPAIALAVLVHALLIAFLWIGINWANDKPETIEAEVWSTKELEAAPAPPPPTPTPQVQTPKEVKAPPHKVEEQPPVEKQPDIALEMEKKRLKKEQVKKEQEKLKEEEKEQAIAEKKEKDKEKDKKDKALAKEKADAKNQADDEKKKLAADNLRERKQKEAADQKLAVQMRQATLKNIFADADAKQGNGSAAKSQGNNGEAAWKDKVKTKVKSNIRFAVPADLDSNPLAIFEVTLLPDGSVAGIRQTKSSGVPGFDEAVRRAISASEPYPKDSTGIVPSSFISKNQPKD